MRAQPLRESFARNFTGGESEHEALCVLESPSSKGAANPEIAGSRCPECGNATLIHRDGCDFCTACGYVGQCG